MSLDDAVQVLLNDEPLHRVTAGHHGTLRAERRKEVKTLGRLSYITNEKRGFICRAETLRATQNFWKTHLRGVSVVEHAEDDSGHWVLGVGHVSRRGEGRQVVLQGLAQHAVEGDVGAQDMALLPAVLLQLLDLGPQTVQVLAGGEERRRLLSFLSTVLFREY